MAANSRNQERSTRPWKGLRWTLLLAMCLACLVPLPGCGGCSKSTPKTKAELEAEKKKREEEKKKKEKEKPKPNFEMADLTTRPSDLQQRERSAATGLAYKPGHWACTTVAAKANNFDFLGDLEMAAVDRTGKVMPLVYTPFDMTTSREVTLAKGRAKRFESLVMIPPRKGIAQLSCRLYARNSSQPVFRFDRLLRPMPSYQYHFVVLARWPDRYTYLEKIHSVKPPTDDLSYFKMEPYYRVSLLNTDRRPLLPSQALLWTSTAYVLWDDAEPTALSEQQQTAMVDWLHWGGQLIISGPDSLGTLADSFLAPYLPATEEATRKLTEADFAPLNSWSGSDLPALQPGENHSGVKLKLHEQARFVPELGELLAERRVGRGRVVVSAIRLSGRSLTTWAGWDQFVNACLLGRPARAYGIDRGDQSWRVTWADARKGNEIDVQQRRAAVDPTRTTQLRYFVRDTGAEPQVYAADTVHQAAEDMMVDPFGAPPALDQSPPPGPGLGAWNDFNPVSNSARKALSTAARVEIPDRSFVLWVLAGYLVVLVPLNWAVFRVIGRVEWAWAVAPVIAIVCTVVVIRMAQLDIGFVRSRTEVAVVELQGGHPRAHVARYTALYASLTTGYQFRFDEAGAMVEPFPDRDRDAPTDRRAALEGRRSLVYRHGESSSLDGYIVGSNTVRFMHGEQMVDLGGGLSLSEAADGTQELSNETELALGGVGILRRDLAGDVQTAWIGEVPSGAKIPLRFRYQSALSAGEPIWQTERDHDPLTAAAPPSGALNLRRLLEIAEDSEQLQPGDVRLVGWVDETIPGMAIKPSPPQVRSAALVVAHLKHGLGDGPQRDINRPPPKQEKLSALDNEPEISMAP